MCYLNIKCNNKRPDTCLLVGCVNIAPVNLETEKATSITESCAQKHERDHFPILQKCECDFKGVKRLDARKAVDLKADECKAYRGTKTCIEKNIPKCGKDRKCREDLNYVLREVEKKIEFYC